MKSILSFALLFVFALHCFGSPLILKTVKEVNSNQLTEVVTIDTAKYRQIQIGVKYSGDIKESADTYEEKNRLITELSDLRRTLNDKHPSVIAKKKQLDEIMSKYEDVNFGIYLSMLDGTDELPICFLNDVSPDKPILVDSPPPKLKISVKGQGVYKIFVWGQ